MLPIIFQRRAAYVRSHRSVIRPVIAHQPLRDSDAPRWSRATQTKQVSCIIDAAKRVPVLTVSQEQAFCFPAPKATLTKRPITNHNDGMIVLLVALGSQITRTEIIWEDDAKWE